MRLTTAALALLVFALPATAQGRWLDTFAVPGAYEGFSFGAAVYAVAPDGAGALVGGEFRLVDGVDVNGVARWTGTAWEALGGGVRCTACFGTLSPFRVQAVARDAAGAVWVAGRFDTVVQPDGTALSVEGLARWTGAAWDAPGRLAGTSSGLGPLGYALLVQGASVVVAGDFADVLRPDGTAVGAANVARWTGGVWEPLSQTTRVYTLATGTDGRILSAGVVPTPGGGEGIAVGAWTGAAWQPVTGVLDSEAAFVYALHVGSDGITVGGAFAGGRTAAGSRVPSRNVIRWDGTAWQPFGRGLYGDAVFALSRGSAGLIAGGQLAYWPDEVGIIFPPPRGLVRWTGTSWVEDTEGIQTLTIAALARDGARTLVGGRFVAQSGSGDATRRTVNLAAIADGGVWHPLSARTGRDGTLLPSGSNEVPRLAPDGCGGVHVYAPFGAGPLTAERQSRSRRWSGTAWAPVPPGLQQSVLVGPAADGPGPYVTAVAGVPGSCDAFVVGGRFGGVAPYTGPQITSINVVLWNGAAWQALGRGVYPTGPSEGLVEAVAVQPSGAVIVGGTFDEVQQADGTVLRVGGVARWTSAGGWAPLGGGLINNFSSQTRRVRALLAEADGSVTIGGRFDIAINTDGTPDVFVDGVARWTGTRWEPLATPLPIEGSQVEIAALARWQGLLVVGGAFTQIRQPGGARLDARSVAAWDGTVWRALPGLDSDVSALAVVDGDLVTSDGLGGRAARWTGTAWVPLGEGAPRNVTSLAAVGPLLYAGGAFDTAGSVGSPGLAVFDLDAPVAAETLPAETVSDALRAYPNPARTTTTLAFHLDAPGAVRLMLIDALGRTVALLADGERAAGDQTVALDVSRLPPGLYLARLDAGGTVRTRTLTVVR